MMRDRLGAHPVPVQVPIVLGDYFHSIIDLVNLVEIIFVEEHGRTTYQEQPIPEDWMPMVDEHRVKMLEALADYDDELLHRYLESHELPAELIKGAIRKGTIAGRITPVLCGSAYRNRGVRLLLDAVVDYLPSPLDMPAVEGENPDTLEQETRPPSSEAPFAAVAFKIMTDPFVGKLVFFRIYSGQVSTGDTVLNVNTGNRERIGRIFRMHANQREEVADARAGRDRRPRRPQEGPHRRHALRPEAPGACSSGCSSPSRSSRFPSSRRPRPTRTS